MTVIVTINRKKFFTTVVFTFENISYNSLACVKTNRPNAPLMTKPPICSVAKASFNDTNINKNKEKLFT
jgi:hypothetical protein